MSTLDELRNARIKKLDELKQKGIAPYPSHITIAGDKIPVAQARASMGQNALVAGRIWSTRGHGAITFIDLKDESGQIQILLKADSMKSGGDVIPLLDNGDFIACAGTVAKTKTGEISIEAQQLQMLAKSLRPLPAEWYGLKDEEELLRKRYLDLLLNPEKKDLFAKKTKFWQTIRDFLLKRGFQEVETPVLETTPGGADAKPFVTHHNAMDIDVYLRISMGELWQKRLMVAGLEKTFEIGRQFRNEGMDPEHLQDYTQMEFYWAYANYENGMEIVEEMVKDAARQTFGTLSFTIGDFTVDLGKTWERYDFTRTIKEMTGLDISTADLGKIEQKLRELGIDYAREGFNITRGIDNLWKYCRRKIAGPGFVIHVPVSVSPLAKASFENPELCERFQIILAGSELGNGYSELNDPLDQEKRFKEQQALRDTGDQEAQMHDHDFVEALEYGMPPTCGFGLSERLFAFLANKTLRECQLFPLLKPKQN